MESRFQQSGFGGGSWGGGGDSGGGGWGRDSGRDSGRGEPGRDSGRGSSSKTASTVDTRKSYKLVSANDKLPKGLPEWFTRNDANGDLQISMAEYSVDWNDAKVAEFAKLDGNGDGVLTTKEVLEPKGTSSLASTSGSLGDRSGSTRGSSRFSFPVARFKTRS